MSTAVIAGTGCSPYSRSPGAGVVTETLLVDAVGRALRDASFGREDVDGFGMSSFTAGPDTAIDLVWRLGLHVRWLMQDVTGGASGINMLQHAVRAIEAGDASVVVLVAGDRLLNREFLHLVDNYNKATRDFLAQIPSDGPNTVFSFVTQRHMRRYGLEREDYGWVAVAQRRWAARNPGAVYRTPLSMGEYLNAPWVAPPLGRYDCVPVVSGADALVLADASRFGRRGVAVRAIKGSHNHDNQEGDGLSTGLARIRAELWSAAGVGPDDIDVVWLYDDYPVMVLIQALDLGLVGDGDLRRFAHVRLGREAFPLNTSGGQLSAGQAGAASGIHGVAEVAQQLLRRAGDRQVEGARLGLVTGYGMVLYRYGACSNVVVLEAR